ncbi:Protein of unknown function [Oceanospirillum multiglobuliferum]|uniref:DUF4240 domain-containing protein n=1 Tax=Oceanospirillum multiglobuliferum TaxID=64969 RepID=A0A1T4ML69_9GAMM|nr:DUF4240 domain-containing protein [Oceanospirillum multiglobuliferum]OPX56977.1 hypothetical protein BTE48_00630 [Oceanospirillum multiglobuliferum]SJZ67742.1 Protein of unknown function [Oceanospirillum multiglobuliferum]
MTEQQFWDIINVSLVQNAPGSDAQYQAIGNSLAQLSPDQLIGFENQLNYQKIRAFTFPVLMANFILQSYINDDIFEDFRLWLISFGQARFNQILEQPDVLADFCEIKDPIEEITGEGLVFAALEAYEQKTGQKDFLKHLTRTEEPEIQYDWPESQQGLARLMPKLYSRYWDSSRSYELSAD